MEKLEDEGLVFVQHRVCIICELFLVDNNNETLTIKSGDSSPTPYNTLTPPLCT